MPYASNKELPKGAKKLSGHKQTAFRKAFNNALKEYGGDESKAFATAYSAAHKTDAMADYGIFDAGGGNPYHDPKTGQFTSGEGSGGGSKAETKLQAKFGGPNEKAKAQAKLLAKAQENIQRSGQSQPSSSEIRSAEKTMERAHSHGGGKKAEEAYATKELAKAFARTDKPTTAEKLKAQEYRAHAGRSPEEKAALTKGLPPGAIPLAGAIPEHGALSAAKAAVTPEGAAERAAHNMLANTAPEHRELVEARMQGPGAVAAYRIKMGIDRPTSQEIATAHAVVAPGATSRSYAPGSLNTNLSPVERDALRMKEHAIRQTHPKPPPGSSTTMRGEPAIHNVLGGLGFKHAPLGHDPQELGGYHNYRSVTPVPAANIVSKLATAGFRAPIGYAGSKPGTMQKMFGGGYAQSFERTVAPYSDESVTLHSPEGKTVTRVTHHTGHMHDAAPGRDSFNIDDYKGPRTCS